MATYRDRLVSLGMTSYWEFAGANHAAGIPDSIGSVNGTWLIDPGQFQYEALMPTDPSSRQPLFRNALSSGADMGNVYDYPGFQVFSHVVWTRLDFYNHATGIVLISNSEVGTGGYWAEYVSSGVLFLRGDAAGDDSTAVIIDPIENISGQIIMWGFVYDGSFLNLYKNGVRVAQDPTAKACGTPPTRTSLVIGCAESGGSGFDGTIGHHATGPVALGPDQMLDLWNLGWGDQIMPAMGILGTRRV